MTNETLEQETPREKRSRKKLIDPEYYFILKVTEEGDWIWKRTSTKEGN